MNDMQLMVQHFMDECGQEVKKWPENPSAEVRQLRKSLMYEELMGPGELVDSIDKGDLVGVADGLADLLYVVFGTAAAYGIDIQHIFFEVHRSNMSKLRPDRTVIRSKDGKIQKPDTYSPPDIKPILDWLIDKKRFIRETEKTND